MLKNRQSPPTRARRQQFICDQVTPAAVVWDSGLRVDHFHESCARDELQRPELTSGFCPSCGCENSRQEIPDGQTRLRKICSSCGRVDYPNPRIVAGCLLLVGGRALLSQRAIQPRAGCWTIPGGFVEECESTEQGARRELAEETGVWVDRACLIAVYEIPQIYQVLFLYVALAGRCHARPGAESSGISLSDPGEVPWNDLAFPTDRRTLHRLRQGRQHVPVEFGRCHWGPDGRILITCHPDVG